MTQNMEKYYGLKIAITEELNPEKLDQLKEIAPNFMKLKGYKPDDYYLYCHNTLMIPNKRHWAKNIPIEDRIESLNLKFVVNEKQREKSRYKSKGKIHFYNWRISEYPIENALEMPLDEIIQYLPADQWMQYSLPGNFIKEHQCFKNLLLTVIDKNVRIDHRKIKLHISSDPTEKYKSKFRNDNYDRGTALDCMFEKPIKVDEADITLLSSPEDENDQKVFISYSHEDLVWLRKLQVHLKPLERRGLLKYWDDTKINTGTKWRDEIKNALNSAKIAILLVSSNFLASDFICDNELPLLLKASKDKGVLLFSIILTPCKIAFSLSELEQFQTLNPLNKPLSKMKNDEQDETLDRLLSDIMNNLNLE